MLYPPWFYYVKKTKRFVILSSDKSSERNLSCFFGIIKPRRIEHLQKEESFSSDPYFSRCCYFYNRSRKSMHIKIYWKRCRITLFQKSRHIKRCTMTILRKSKYTIYSITRNSAITFDQYRYKYVCQSNLKLRG